MKDHASMFTNNELLSCFTVPFSLKAYLKEKRLSLNFLSENTAHSSVHTLSKKERKIMANGTKLVLLSFILSHCFIVTSNNWIEHTMQKSDLFYWNITQGISFLLYPIFGWIADVYVSHYKMIKIAFILILLSSLIMLISAIERILEHI